METSKNLTEAIAAEGTMPVEGTELYYRSVGSGTPPVITVHGGPGLGHYYLRPGMDALADRFRVVYYDQRGSGRSELGDPDRVTLAGGIDDLKALIEGLGIERANLVGHSFGADLIALFASRHPDRVASLVLANPGPPFDPDQQSVLWAEMARRRTPEDLAEWERIQGSEGFAARDPAVLEAHVRMMYMPFFSDRALASTVSYGFTAVTAANFPEAGERTYRDLDPPAAIAGLKAIECPTLVVRAELDPIPEAFSRQVADAIPGARYSFIRGANHFTYLEAPKPFFAAVGDFLSEEAR
ncbi:MAG TPA: alpha/beta hydrolase [Actinomycetota bacterium]|jgi:proline iminopeptidase